MTSHGRKEREARIFQVECELRSSPSTCFTIAIGTLAKLRESPNSSAKLYTFFPFSFSFSLFILSSAAFPTLSRFNSTSSSNPNCSFSQTLSASTSFSRCESVVGEEEEGEGDQGSKYGEDSKVDTSLLSWEFRALKSSSLQREKRMKTRSVRRL